MTTTVWGKLGQRCEREECDAPGAGVVCAKQLVELHRMVEPDDVAAGLRVAGEGVTRSSGPSCGVPAQARFEQPNESGVNRQSRAGPRSCCSGRKTQLCVFEFQLG